MHRLDYTKDKKLENNEGVIHLKTSDGHPDGMTVDKDGNLWLCHFAGKKVTKYTESGQKIAEYEMPVSNITSCTFVGENLDAIVFTTAKVGLSEQQLKQEPTAGGLFIAKANAFGMQVHAFAG